MRLSVATYSLMIIAMAGCRGCWFWDTFDCGIAQSRWLERCWRGFGWLWGALEKYADELKRLS